MYIFRSLRLLPFPCHHQIRHRRGTRYPPWSGEDGECAVVSRVGFPGVIFQWRYVCFLRRLNSSDAGVAAALNNNFPSAVWRKYRLSALLEAAKLAEAVPKDTPVVMLPGANELTV